MVTQVHAAANLDDLRAYVVETLCAHFQLDPLCFKLRERILYRRQIPCGIYFVLEGPRGVWFSAIWEIEANRVFFYGLDGQRIQSTQLLLAPDLRQAVSSLVSS